MGLFMDFLLREEKNRGWTSPNTGKMHRFSGEDVHHRNHHPEISDKIKWKPGKTVNGRYHPPHAPIEHAQKHGFVRHGTEDRDYNNNYSNGRKLPPEEHSHFVHYDGTHPKGKSTAHIALKKMNPHPDSKVTITSKRGSTNLKGHEKEMSAKHALVHLKNKD